MNVFGTKNILNEWSDEQWDFKFFNNIFKNSGKVIFAENSEVDTNNKVYENVLKHNFLSIKDFMYYIDNEDIYHIIQNRLDKIGHKDLYDKYKDEMNNEIKNYFLKYRNKIEKDSSNYQLKRFHRHFNISKYDYLSQLFLSSSLPVEYKRDKINDKYVKDEIILDKENNIVHIKDGTKRIIIKDRKERDKYSKTIEEMKNSEKVLIPCNIYYYLILIDEIIDSIARMHFYCDTRNKEYHTPKLKYKKILNY